MGRITENEQKEYKHMNPDNINLKNTPASVSNDDEIDLIQLVKTLWVGRRTVVKTTFVFMALGLFVALFSAKEYTASITMVPQSAEGGSKLGGDLGGLAAMAGINLGSVGGGSSISPSLYPKIIASVPFQKELMQTLISIEGEKEEVTFAYYYKVIHRPGLFEIVKKYTIGLPRFIKEFFRNEVALSRANHEASSLLTISYREKRLMEKLSDQISLEVNDKDGYVSIYARMPEARQAAEMVQGAQELLQEVITNFKIKKAKEQMTFVEERYAEKEAAFSAAQNKLARFRDQNRNVSTAVAQTQLERLQSEFSMASSVYIELAKQLETQKIQVKEDTPVFTIVEPAVVPLQRSKPKRLITLIIYTFLGGVVGVGMVFGKEFLGSIRKQWEA